MYQVKYSRFLNKYLVLGFDGIAHSVWRDLREARLTASKLNHTAWIG